MERYQDALRVPVSRRRFLWLTGITAGVVSSGLLAACGSDDDGETPPSTGSDATPTTGASTGGDATATPGDTADTTPAAEAPTSPSGEGEGAPGGELIVAATQDGYRTEPNRANVGQYPLNTNIFETLVRLTPDYQVEPVLAESWEFVEPNTWRFLLREGVTFHDGTPFTAEAVQWSMGRIAAVGGGQLGVDETSVEIVDDFTVAITPSRTNLRVIQQISHPSNSIVAPDTEPAEIRVGTGPFMEVEYLPEDRYVVEANPDYWGDAPQLSQITFRFIPDPTTRVLALQSGEVDLVVEVPRESARDLTSMDGLSLVTSKVGAYEALYVNIHGEEPYDLGQEKAVREAVAYGIDKDSIVNGVWQGNAEISNTMIPPAILGDAGDIITGTTFDPDRARQILEDAGWVEGSGGVREKDGRQLKLTMIVGFPNAEIHTPMPEFVQAQLADIGIEMDIVQTPDTAIYEARLQTGEGDLWAEAGSQNDGNPCFLPDLLFYSPDPEGDPESMAYGNAFAPGAAFDAHIDDCRAAVTTEEVQDAAAEAMKVLVDDEFVVIPLAGTFRLYGVSAKVQGFEAHPSGVNQRWASVSVDEG
ncbi:MAG: ABC transporter substrate-binding protein [Chloroflexia bacterium]|nr:ABC transporter substrate-binding protein [Chloroflexia bacterium]